MHPTYKLGHDEVHIWQIAIDDPRWGQCFGGLSGDELERAACFQNRELQLCYKRTRSALRVLLARYAGQSPSKIRFRYGTWGKPEISHQPWHFNLSHSERLAVVAIGSWPVGIDLERIDMTQPDVGEMTDMVCHPEERRVLARLSDVARREQFYRLWVQKEAYFKALGCGLRRQLRVVRFVPLDGARVARVLDEHATDDEAFFVYPLPFLNGYTASICTTFSEATIHFFNDSTLMRSA